jgi:hypothetical protein
MHLADRLRALERDLSQAKEHADRKNIELAGVVEQLLAAVEGE